MDILYRVVNAYLGWFQWPGKIYYFVKFYLNYRSTSVPPFKMFIMCKGRRDYRMPSKWPFSRCSWRDYNVPNGRWELDNDDDDDEWLLG